MKKLSLSKTEIIRGGLCIDRPDPGQETSGIFCPGICHASQIVFSNTGHGIGGPDGFVCLA